MPTVRNVYDKQTQLLSELWNQQAGPHFDLVILILGVINVAAACLVLSTIIYDARVLANHRSLSIKPYARSFLGRARRVSHIHPAEVLPLVISIAIAAQGTVYIIVQSMGLHTLVATCKTVAQVVWPALWIVPYTILAFGVETTVRSLQGKRFPCPTSLGVCPTTLVWWTINYTDIGLAAGSGLLFCDVVCAIIITLQLMRTVDIDRNQRIAASRAVYYLIVSASLTTLMVPFFAQRVLGMDALRAAWVAEVSLNLYGLVALVLHMSLRSNADRMAIQPLEATRPAKKRLRLFGPSNLEITMHMTSPVLLGKEEGRYADDDHGLMTGLRTDSSPTASELERQDSSNADFMNQIVAEYLSPVRPPPQVSLSPCTPRKGSNYSIFPTFRSAMLRTSMSTTFSEDEDAQSLQLPKPLAPFNHKREISEQTSATVQIGYRLSNMSDAQPLRPLSPTASSCCLPLRGVSDSFMESPPVSPLSSRPSMARMRSQDTVILPMQSQKHDQHDVSILNFLTPDWDGPRQSSSRATLKRDRPMTMKALPPIPPIDDSPTPSNHPVPRLSLSQIAGNQAPEVRPTLSNP
ncbi:MAG: hypothetical protein Q9213_007513 [Squamulea squamosa]